MRLINGRDVMKLLQNLLTQPFDQPSGRDVQTVKTKGFGGALITNIFVFFNKFYGTHLKTITPIIVKF
jgi:hypothetical protein